MIVARRRCSLRGAAFCSDSSAPTLEALIRGLFEPRALAAVAQERRCAESGGCQHGDHQRRDQRHCQHPRTIATERAQPQPGR
jgi:hypothetical protein